MDEPIRLTVRQAGRLTEAINAVLYARSLLVPGVDQDVHQARFALDVAFKSLELMTTEDDDQDALERHFGS